MLQPGTTVQYLAPHKDWGAYGAVTGDLGDSATYTVDLLPPRTGTAEWGHTSVVRVWDAPNAEDALPPVPPGGTIPVPGLRPVFRSRRPPLPRPAVGSLAEARTVADWSPECSPYGDPDGWTPIGEGAHRAVILNPAHTTVYKIETEPGRNRREHRALRRLRRQGHGHAPPATLWTVPGPAHGAGRGIEVLAMPYLPRRHRAAQPRAGVVDLNPADITVCRSRYWLIDASGL